jgi:hypothetical protein
MAITRSKSHTQDSLVFDAVAILPLPPDTISGAVVSTAPALQFALPYSIKIQDVAITATNAGLTVTGSGISFNVVAGVLPYEGAVPATGIATLYGRNSPNSPVNINVVMPNGHVITVTIPINQSAYVAIQSVITALNADTTFNATYYAYYTGIQNGGPSLQISTIATGVSGNGAVFTFSVLGQGYPTFTWFAPTTTLGGGAASGAPIVVAPNDTVESLKLLTSAQPGQALFAADQVIAAAPSGTVQTFYPTQFDAIWPAGTLVTIRFSGTPSSTTTFNVEIGYKPYNMNNVYPDLLPFSIDLRELT